jgi:integrase
VGSCREAGYGFVFARDDKEKSAVPYCSIDTQHDRTLKKLSLHIRIYDFRHSFGTRLGESGADADTICKLMGHSNIQISARYVHPTPERIELAFAGLDAYNQERAKAAKEKADKEAHKPQKPSLRQPDPLQFPPTSAERPGSYAGPLRF